MVSLILMTRGVNHEFERWKKFMEAQQFLFPQTPFAKYEEDVYEKGTGKLLHSKGEFKKDKDGKYIYRQPIRTFVQGVLRPIQLFEYTFPQESLQEVLAMMNCHKDYNEMRPEAKAAAWMVRKAMKLKPLPDMPELKKKERWEVTQKMVPMTGMAVYPLGLKEDRVGEIVFDLPNGTKEGYYQEWL